MTRWATSGLRAPLMRFVADRRAALLSLLIDVYQSFVLDVAIKKYRVPAPGAPTLVLSPK